MEAMLIGYLAGTFVHCASLAMFGVVIYRALAWRRAMNPPPPAPTSKVRE